MNLGTRFRRGGGRGGGGHGVEAFKHPGQVVEEHVGHVVAEVLADHDAEQRDLLGVRRQVVRRDDPTVRAEAFGDVVDRVGSRLREPGGDQREDRRSPSRVNRPVAARRPAR